MNGVAVSTTGETFWWNAKRAGNFKESNKSDNLGEVKMDVPKLEFNHYPAGAYGVERKIRDAKEVHFKNGTVWTSGRWD